MNQDNKDILVSVSCITYNHAPYIRQCLDGFMMQQTNFLFEVLIHDDASTDGTTEIIREYAAKYPDIIKPLYEEENQWLKGRRGSAVFNFPRAKGKYIALCEGDDYWTDPLKLQKQVDFLESHPDYTMCFARAIEHFENEKKEDQIFSLVEDREYKGVELFENWIVPTASVLFRREIIDTKLYESYQTNEKIIFGDTPLFLTCAHYGKIRGFNDVFSVYRKHERGVNNITLKNLEHYKKFQFHVLELHKVFGHAYQEKSIEFFVTGHCNVFWNTFWNRGVKTRYDYLYEALFVSFSGCVRFFYNKLIRKMRRLF